MPHETKSEYVRHLLEHNGGRIYQADIVEAVDWSKSTVSRALRRMERDGQVRRYRTGRRKVVCLPDHVPEFVEGAT